MQIGAGDGVIESVEEPAHLGAATRGRKAAAFGEEIQFRNARGTLMADDLNDAGHGVSTIQSALRAVHKFDFVHVIEREIGINQVAAGEIHRCAVDENLGEAGIAAVNEDGREAADRAGSRETDAGLRGAKVRKRNCLALFDFLTSDNVDGGGGVGELRWLGICGDDDVLGKGLNFQAKVERAVFGRGKIENDVMGYEGRVLEMNVIAAWRNGEEISAVSAGNRRPDARV